MARILNLRYNDDIQYFKTMAHRQFRPHYRHFISPSMSLFMVLQNYLSSVPNDKPLKQIKNDLISFSQKNVPDAQKYILTQLMQSTQLSQNKDKPNISLRATLLSEMIKQFSSSEHFLAYFPEIVIKVTKENKVNQYINHLMNNIKLPLSTQIPVALSLYLSDRSELISIGQNQLIGRLKQYQNSDKSIKLSQKLLEQLLFQIHMSPQLNNKLNNQVKTLLQAVQKINKNSQSRIYNYFRDQWQFFTNDTPNIQKPPVIALKKSDILRDFGPSFTLQMETMKTIISDIGPLNQQDVFQCLMMMTEQRSKHDNHSDRFVTDLMYLSSANSSKKNPKYNQDLKNFFKQDFSKNNYDGKIISWNIDNFLAYCSQNIQNIKWQNVFANFDRENLTFYSEEHFVQIMRIFEKVKKFVKKWAMSDSIIFRIWVHPASQAEFLLYLFSCKESDCLNFNEAQSKKSQGNSKDTSVLREIWGCFELLTLLFQVSEHKTQKIIQLFDVPIVRYPDTLIKTLAQIQPTKGQQLVDQIYGKVLPQFLQNDGKSIKVLQYLWQIDKNQLLSTLLALNDPERNLNKRRYNIDLEKIVQIFQQIPGSLEEIIMLNQSSFTLPLALIAGKKQAINFEKWLITKLEEDQNGFARQLLYYLQNNLFQQLRVASQIDQKDNILQEANLSSQILNKIFTIVIEKLKKQNSSKFVQSYKRIHKECCQLFPEVAQGHISQQAQKQCEEEIKRIYIEEISIKSAVQNLARLKNSNKKQQRQQFANRITFLCIELTYHHSYPQKQLMITADLFSELINANLIQKKIFQVFLHVIDEYLKEDNQKFVFALKVMETIKDKLAHESWFCQKLIDNDLIMRKDPQLIESIIKSIVPPKILSIEKQKKLKDAIRKKNTPEIVSRHIIIQPEVHHQEVVNKPEITQFDILSTLDRAKKIDLHDRQAKLRLINTICNTLSTSNIEQKAKQLKKTLDSEKIIKLFAYNLIFKRITMTQNNSIQVFLKLLEIIPRAEKPVMDITYKILQSWFNLTGKSVNDKKFSHFKNIGGWLGRMTIGKGIPVPIYKLNLKNILVKSFVNNNRINFNIPVVLKILQLIHVHPDMFRPQSPWLRKIMCALIEIQTNLKQDQQIKTEIRAFFKSTKMDIQHFLSQPSLLSNQSELSFNQLVQMISTSEEITKFCEGFEINNYRTLIARALDQSIQQIVQPVIDRTVKIAKTTTRQIITKDFPTQTNAQKVKQSSLNLAKQLAAPLAQVTCRQPLKTNLVKNLKQYLKQQLLNSKAKQQQIQQLIHKIVGENLQIGSNLIKQKVARSAERAMKEDHDFMSDLQLRNMLKRQGQPYRNQQYLSSIPSVVPKELKPNNNGITEEQYGIYNQLKKLKNKPFNVHKQNSSEELIEDNIIDLIEQKQSVDKIKRALENQQIQEQEVLEKVFACLLEENNDEMEENYYLEVCQTLKQAIDPKVCWKVFKEVGNFRNKTSQRMIGKLVRTKFFEESALKQLFEEQQKSIKFFQKWVKQVTQQNVAKFVQQLQKSIGYLQGNIKIFFLYCLKYVINKISEQTSEPQQTPSILYVEQFIKLAVAYYKNSKNNFKICIQEILQSLMEGFLKFQPKSSNIHHQRTFFKIIANLISIFNSTESEEDTLPKQKLQAFNCSLSKQLLKINPVIKPSFAFSWLQIIYNKYLIKGLLQNYGNWELYFNLLCSLLRFMKDNITVVKLNNNQYGLPYQTFYQAVLRLIIVIIHDFSSFLSQFSLELCLLVDSSFIQLKNIIVSAFPTKSSYPLKFERNQDLQQLAQKGGYPKYYKLTFDKNKLNSYLNADPKDAIIRQKFMQQDELFLQTFVLYTGWKSQSGLNPNQAIAKMTDIISNSKQDIRTKLVNYVINLIRYPNHITLFFMNFANYLIFKNKDNELRELMLANIIARMTEEVPIAWGLIYFGKEIISMKKELQNLGVNKELLEQL